MKIVLVLGLPSIDEASREVLRPALIGRYEPLFGNVLWSEYRIFFDARCGMIQSRKPTPVCT